MCGIVGAVSQKNILPILIEGLERLEYRGYDSSGIAFIKEKKIIRKRSCGKVQNLIKIVKKNNNISGNIGIAHTRWATHGVPSVKNAHPHFSYSGDIAIVHNGIIENFIEIKKNLSKKSIIFNSNTDTEIIAHLLDSNWNKKKSLLYNIQKSIKYIKGAYGLAIIHKDYPNNICVVRSGSPIIIGYGENENFISSDTFSLLKTTNKFSYLDEGDTAVISNVNISIFDKNGKEKSLNIKKLDDFYNYTSKGKFNHYMKKEIFEQPKVAKRTFEKYITTENKIAINIFGKNSEKLLKKIEQIKIVGCGTSFHAGLVAKNWIEEYADIFADVEIASEIRYKKTIIRKNTLYLTVSQSGETADTLAALRQAKKLSYLTSLAICNVENSSLSREAKFVFITKAGIEMGVASTKAFTTQLIAFLLFAISLAKIKNKIKTSEEQKIIIQLKQIPLIMEKVLLLDKEIEHISKNFINKKQVLILGRGIQFPVALEGALKLKEISYIYAEAYPAGELKHGPLALVDKNMPVVSLIPNNNLLEKIDNNLQEVQARGGELYLFIDESVKNRINTKSKYTFLLESIPEIISPIIFTIPLKLFSYHVAVKKGTDIDQPRNLAKSVTVE